MATRQKTVASSDRVVMTPAAFRRWRKQLRLSQKGAAEALGLKPRALQYYEKGERDGRRVVVPRTVRLACYALTTGVSDYAGPTAEEAPARSIGAARTRRPAPRRLPDASGSARHR